MSAEPAYLSLTPEGIRFCPLCGARLERRAVGPDNKPEMVCTGCGFVYFLGQKVVACTIAMTAERILLTRRAINPANGKWTFPGGYVEWGEPVESAAIRETYEETGLAVDLCGLVGVYSYPNGRVEWVEREGIPWDELAFPSTTAALTDFLRARPFFTTGGSSDGVGQMKQ